MIVLSNTAAQTIQPGAAATFDVVKLHTGCGEFHRAGSGSVRLRTGLYAFEFTGNVGSAAGTQPNLAIAVDGDGEGRMGYRNQYGNFPANPKNRRRRMRRSGYSEESIDDIRQMMEDADPERKRQLKRDLEELMSEM